MSLHRLTHMLQLQGNWGMDKVVMERYNKARGNYKYGLGFGKQRQRKRLLTLLCWLIEEEDTTGWFVVWHNSFRLV